MKPSLEQRLKSAFDVQVKLNADETGLAFARFHGALVALEWSNRKLGKVPMGRIIQSYEESVYSVMPKPLSAAPVSDAIPAADAAPKGES